MVPLKENDLIEALYDAALGYRTWAEVGQNLMEQAGGQTLMLSTHHSRTRSVNVLGWLGMRREALPEYAAFAPHDLWHTGYVEQRRFGRAMIGSDVVEERALTGSLIYNDYLRPKVGVHHLVGAVLPMDGGYQAVLGIHRPRDAKNFSPADAKQLTRLLPHVQRALEVRRRLQQADQTSSSVHSILDHLSVGVIMLGANGRLLHVNTAADSILRRADGLARTPGGLRAAHKEDEVHLQALIAGLRQGAAGGHLRLRRPSGLPAYVVMLSPVGPMIVGGEQGLPATLVFVSAPGEKIVSDLAVLAELFGFPPAEARIVLALLSGVTPPEFARRSGITYNTAKTLLARAMARTDTRSQLELVVLATRSIGATMVSRSM
jgi:DNA-binding CsgD family transcriptional regulator/PAS domain-containing protein